MEDGRRMRAGRPGLALRRGQTRRRRGQAGERVAYGARPPSSGAAQAAPLAPAPPVAASSPALGGCSAAASSRITSWADDSRNEPGARRDFRTTDPPTGNAGAGETTASEADTEGGAPGSSHPHYLDGVDRRVQPCLGFNEDRYRPCGRLSHKTTPPHPCEDALPLSACPFGRAHVCRHCWGPHPADSIGAEAANRSAWREAEVHTGPKSYDAARSRGYFAAGITATVEVVGPAYCPAAAKRPLRTVSAGATVGRQA